jgi:hypothetical protein
MHRNYTDANKRSKRVEYGELVNAVVNFRSIGLLGARSSVCMLQASFSGFL